MLVDWWKFIRIVRPETLLLDHENNFKKGDDENYSYRVRKVVGNESKMGFRGCFNPPFLGMLTENLEISTGSSLPRATVLSHVMIYEFWESYWNSELSQSLHL